MPNIIVKLLSHLNPQMAMLRPELGRTRLIDSSKARTQLGWHPRPTEQTIVDTATALIANNALSRQPPPSRSGAGPQDRLRHARHFRRREWESSRIVQSCSGASASASPRGFDGSVLEALQAVCQE
ncbi:hypothetical protein [Microbispora sp. H10830]|uniref:hypothetical protein n=1 Tax=Microbispora sp. H10830 TaxID=2729109 RepID=UPI0016016262|nr:hypothetical protein [Microbispora sp. H10830]